MYFRTNVVGTLIEVRFDGAENALARLFALAQALGNDYVRFEELVGR